MGQVIRYSILFLFVAMCYEVEIASADPFPAHDFRSVRAHSVRDTTELNGSTSGADAASNSDSMPIVGDNFTRSKFAMSSEWGDSNWCAGFGVPGVMRAATVPGFVGAMTIFQGKLVIAGSFSVVGNIKAHNIATWNGQSWDALGDEISGEVNALTLFEGRLIAGGLFSLSASTSRSNIAEWDGNTWRELGGGVNDRVLTLDVFDGELVAGGYFSMAGGVSANRIATWNGVSWRALGSGTNGYVIDLEVFEGKLFAGGWFFLAGGAPANNIASWDGFNWSPLASGTTGYSGSVNKLATFQNELIVGGDFGVAGGISSNFVASWTGSNWKSIQGVNRPSGVVTCLAVVAGHLRVSSGWGSNASRMQDWDGTNWTWAGQSDGSVYELVTFGEKPIAAGSFRLITEDGQLDHRIGALGIAQWDGDNWLPMWSGVNDQVQALSVWDGKLILGGTFTSINGMRVNGVASWDGQVFQSLASGMNGQVCALAVYNGKLIATGDFTTAGGIPATNIASWDGVQWSSLGHGISSGGGGRSLAVFQDKLVVGGHFTFAGGFSANRVAAWDGQYWSSIGTGTNGPVFALTVSDNKLVAGGLFSSAGGRLVNNIASWDGLDWQPLGVGVNSSVFGLSVHSGELIACGSFSTAGGEPAKGIATWDGVTWEELGGGIENTVLSIITYSDELVAVGNFSRAGNTSTSGIASWDGNTWNSLGAGFNGGSGRALAEYGGTLYAGGGFIQAGNSVSGNLACFSAEKVCSDQDCPDLNILRVDIPLEVTSGSPCQVEWEVMNSGAVPTSSIWIDRVYVSRFAASGPDSLVGSREPNLNLPLGDSYTLGQSLNFVDGQEGDWWVKVRTDATDVVDELSETNNFLVSAGPINVKPFPYPDLVVTSVTSQAEVVAGSTLKVDWEVANLGGTLAVGGWTDRIYLSADSLIGGDMEIYSRDRSGNLSVNQSYFVSQKVPIPKNLEGLFFVIVQSDVTNSVKESGSATNNFGIATIPSDVTPFPYPNLVVDSIEIPPSAFAGREVALRWFVSNKGMGGTNAGSWSDRIYLSPIPTFDPFVAQFIQDVANFSALDSSEAYVNEASFTLPRDKVGSYYIFVATDITSRVEEKNENDNRTVSAAIEIEIPPLPDMEIDSLFGPTSAIPGQDITINWVDHNSGDANADRTWTDAFYLSLDQSLDANDKLILSRTHQPAAPGGIEDDFPTSLPAGGRYAGTTTVKLPYDLYGVYYLLGVIDRNDVIFEFTGESNNSTIGNQIDLTLIGPPDFVVTSVSSDASGNSGKKISVTWTVQNTGAGSTVDDQTIWDDRIYLSQSPLLNVLDANTKVLGTFAGGSGQFDSGEEYTFTKEVTIPNGLQGTYYLFVSTDIYNEEWENGVDSNNTTRRVDPIEVFLSPWPDLQVTSISTVDAATSGEQVSIDFTVSNLGQADVDSVARQDRVYISQLASFNGEAQLLSTSTAYSPMQVNGEYASKVDVTIPSSYEGTCYFYVQTDVLNSVYEHSDEDNNVARSGPLAVGVYPFCDLAVTNATAPASALSGEEVDVQWTVANISGAATIGSQWRDLVYFSNDNTVGNADDVLLKSFDRNGILAPGASYDRAQKVRLPYGVSGNRYLFVVTDEYGNVRESNDGNNASNLLPISITQSPDPDLQMANVEVVGRLTAGQPVSVNWQVNNIGVGNAQQQKWFDGIYLSPDDDVSPSDLRLGVLEHSGGLPTAGNYLGTTSVELPNYLVGQYYLIVKGDNQDVVYEGSSESNNAASKSIRITFAPLSDLVVTDIIVPDSASPGDEITVSWTLHNQGVNPAQGFMREAVFVSSDSIWQLEDPALGVRDVEIDIAPGATKQFSAKVSLGTTYRLNGLGEITEELPGVLPGEFRCIVKADLRNSIRESIETNNDLASISQLTVDIPSLSIGVPIESILEAGQSRYFKLDVEGGTDLAITLSSDQDGSANHLFVSHKSIPLVSNYELSSNKPFESTQEVSVPSASAGVYYILVHGGDQSVQNQRVTLLASEVDFSLTSIEPNRGGQGGQVTCKIKGGGFRSGMKVLLQLNGLTITEGEIISLANSTEAKVRFSLRHMSLGSYDCLIERQDHSFDLTPKAFTVEPLSGYVLENHLTAPDKLRQESVGIYELTLRNKSNVDLPYVLVDISVPSGQDISVVSNRLLTGNQFASLLGMDRDSEDYLDDGSIRRVFLTVPNVEAGEDLDCRILLSHVKGSPHTYMPLRIGVKAMDEITLIGTYLASFEQTREELLASGTLIDPELRLLLGDPEEFSDRAALSLVKMGLADQSDLPFIDSLAPFSLADLNLDVPAISDHRRIPAEVDMCTIIDLNLFYWTCNAFLLCGNPFGLGIVASLGPIGIAACALMGAACLVEIMNLYASINGESSPIGTDLTSCLTSRTLGEWHEIGMVPLKCLLQTTLVKECREIVSSNDPNDIIGPVGYGDDKWLKPTDPMAYTIRFENDSLKATAPAQVVEVTQHLDTDLDWRSLRLGSFNFAGMNFDVPANTAIYSKRLDVRDKLNVFVDVTAGIKLGSGEAFWTFRSIDPLTGTTPTDPLAGLLPVNNAAGDGNGFVSYTIKPKSTSQSGDIINAEASIVFDINEPIVTPAIFNTIDAVAPISAINPLPAISSSNQVSLQWLAEDPLPGSGIRDYSLFVSTNDSAFVLVASGITTQSFMFEGEIGNTYEFYTIAYDNVGNAEAAPSVPDASTTIGNAICGDFDGSGTIRLTDVVYMVNYIFLGGPKPIDPSGGDINCDHKTNITDAVITINYLYAGGPAPCAGCN